MELRSYIVEKQMRFVSMQMQHMVATSGLRKQKMNTNSIVPYVMEEITKLIGKPTQKGQNITIIDNISNTIQFKAIKSVTSNGELVSFFELYKLDISA